MKQALENYMHERALTQEALASTLGVQRSHLSKLLSGNRRPSLKLLAKIHKITGISYEELIDG
jgi:transcriptional regulator with XRE-family HTH domain